jgi:hypothetical protein
MTGTAVNCRINADGKMELDATMADKTWPFADAPNTAVFTTRFVIKNRMPITHVSHDAEDGAWQFHTNSPFDDRDAMLVALKEIVDIDPSVTQLADLPLGSKATRLPNGHWLRESNR